MTHVANQDLGTLFSTLADIIEGGNDNAGGEVMQGIPGVYSNDPKLMDGTEDEVTATAAGSTTAVPVGGKSWSQSRWNKPSSARYFLLCTSATNSENVNEARRINDWVVATRQFTTEPFPAAVSTGDVFAVLQGFRRFPDDQDFEDEETLGAFDRFFVLDMDDGGDRNIRGKGIATRETMLTIRLRLLHHQRVQKARSSAFANAAMIREAMMKSVNRTGQLACVLSGGGTTIGRPNDYNIEVAISIPIIYRMYTGL